MKLSGKVIISLSRVVKIDAMDGGWGSEAYSTFNTPVLATWLIRPEMSGKRGLSWYFTAIRNLSG